MGKVQDIEERNRRVENDKAWEVSLTRRFIIAALTYIVALVWLIRVADDPHPYVNALVPALGYWFSMLSLPLFKKWWTQRYGK